MSTDYITRFSHYLARFEVKYAFGVVGNGPSLNLVSALEANSIQYYPVAHEAAAALMAGSCCCDGKTKAVAIGIKGPGFINFLPGTLSNYYENRPALTISEAYSPSVPAFRKHKRIDHSSFCSSIVKQFATWDNNFQTIKNLLMLACQEIPGPIHIDLCNEPVQNNKMEAEFKITNEEPVSQYTEKVLQAIKSSKKPAVILGSCVSRKLNKLNWNMLNIPVVTTAAAKGCIDEESPYAGGIITGEIKDLSPESTILKKADLLIAFGLRNTEMVLPKPFSVPLIIVDAVDEGLHDGFEALVCLINRNLLSLASVIFETLLEKNWGEDIVRSHWSEVEKELFKDQWLPAQVLRQLQSVIGQEAILTLDTGLFCTIGETVWKARSPNNFCGSSNGRFMGTAIPSAIGLAISSPRKKIICVAGDGGIRPYLPEIKIAVNQKLPILFILMSDGYYGSVAVNALGKSISKKAYQIENHSWWRAIEAMGCPSAVISNDKELEKSLCHWLKNEGVLFMEMNFNPDKYFCMTNRLR